MEKSFSSFAELQAEIQFLKVQQFHQEENLKEKFSNPTTIFQAITGLFKSSSSNKSLVHDFMNQDMITNISRVILPLFLNGVIFKKSGFIVKTLVTFLSQKAAKKVNSNAISGIIDKVSGLFKSRTASTGSGHPKIKDYGIPPDSETY
ncbi:hypothetical protein [Pedobacter sp. SYSU D00535]|uniref:hypothetical protein n=1 Tax=Pedobacter sp. SYSU D00535 TaxID=2810308 RepID=UPI001A973490|nr:hypothetical protein [Pedobacter sp. SYSU D00535]